MDVLGVNGFKELLAVNNVVVTGDIFVYKSGFIGNAYVNKEELAYLGADVVNNCLTSMTQRAVLNGLTFEQTTKTVLLIGPAYGAISYPPIVAMYLCQMFPNIKFITARTQLDSKEKHYIPDKLHSLFKIADEFVVIEDIVNQGTTILEVSALLPDKIHSVICLVDRGGNDAEKLGIKSFYPFLSVDMKQFDPRIDPSLLSSGMKINTILGKGKMWVDQFGQPPYGDDVDFSKFSLLK